MKSDIINPLFMMFEVLDSPRYKIISEVISK